MIRPNIMMESGFGILSKDVQTRFEFANHLRSEQPNRILSAFSGNIFKDADYQNLRLRADGGEAIQPR